MLPLRDDNHALHFPFWVVTIILANLIMFILEVTSPNPDQFVLNYALIPALVNLHDPTTWSGFVTSQFVHGGFIHIISNMWFFWIFGDNVEDQLGFLFFPIFYLISGILGGILQYIFIPDSQIPMIGASGAIAGVLGSYLAFFPTKSVKTLVFLGIFITVISVPAYLMLFYWFITQIIGGFAIVHNVNQADLGGVAYFAHVGGFIFGYLYSKLLVIPSIPITKIDE